MYSQGYHLLALMGRVLSQQRPVQPSAIGLLCRLASGPSCSQPSLACMDPPAVAPCSMIRMLCSSVDNSEVLQLPLAIPAVQQHSLPYGRPLQDPQATPASYSPWTATRHLVKKSRAIRRMRFLMQVLETEAVAKAKAGRAFPDFRSGDILEVRVMVPENERKEYMFRGVCIARYNKGPRTTFKIYNVFPDVGGVVQHFPLYMPDMLEVKVVGQIKTRKSKLYYLTKQEENAADHSYQKFVTAIK